MPEYHLQEADEVLLEQLYRQMGNAPEGELVSEVLRERREEALKEALDGE